MKSHAGLYAVEKSVWNKSAFGTDTPIASETRFEQGHGLAMGKRELKAQTQVALGEMEKNCQVESSHRRNKSGELFYMW